MDAKVATNDAPTEETVDQPLAIEDYALIGDCLSGALVGRNGSIDWLCWPRFDSDACFAALLGTSRHGRWLIAPRAAVTKTSRHYRGDTMVLETLFETDEGSVAVIDFMPIGFENSSIVRRVEGRSGSRGDAHGTCPAVRLRRIDAMGHAPAGLLRHPRRLWPECRDALHAGGADGRKPEHRVGFRRRGKRDGGFHSRLGRLTSAAAALFRPRQGPLEDGTLLAGLVRALQIRRLLEEARSALAADAEGADLSADRRYRRGADDVAARTIGRPAQLGLPLLLAARFHLDADRLDGRRLLRGGAILARLAAPHRRRQSRSIADHVRDRRRAASRRMDAVVAARLSGRRARAHRQCRVRAIAARCLWRDDRRALSRPQRRIGGRDVGLVDAGQFHRSSADDLGQARRRYLGSARRTPPFHPFQSHGLGGARPNDPGRRDLWIRCAARYVERRSRDDACRDLRQRFRPKAQYIHAKFWQ